MLPVAKSDPGGVEHRRQAQLRAFRQAVVAVREPPCDQGAGVGRDVVDHHGLEVVDALVERRIQAIGEVLLDVAGGDDHA
jgi:hypothetical protein